MEQQFGFYLLALLAYFGTMAIVAKIGRPQSGNRPFLAFWQNATNWCSFVPVNVIVAIILTRHLSSWWLPGLGFAFVVSTIVSVGTLTFFLLPDSKANWSDFYKDGLLTMAGGMQHFGLWPFQVSTIVGLYVLTKPADVPSHEFWFVTLISMTVWIISNVQPPLKMHGRINGEALAGALGGAAIIAGLAIYHAKFA